MPKSFNFGLFKVVPAKRETLLGYAHSAPVCARVSRVRAGVLCVSALEQGFPLRRCARAPRFKRYFAAFCDDNAPICVYFAPGIGGPLESCAAFLMFVAVISHYTNSLFEGPAVCVLISVRTFWSIKSNALCLIENFLLIVGDGFLISSIGLTLGFFPILRKNRSFFVRWSAIRPFFIFALLFIILRKLFPAFAVLFVAIVISYDLPDFSRATRSSV